MGHSRLGDELLDRDTEIGSLTQILGDQRDPQVFFDVKRGGLQPLAEGRSL
jgi:hypothetical protein